MPFVLPPIAVAASADRLLVARFGHSNPLLVISASGEHSERDAAGCCGNLARLVGDCDTVICSEIGSGAAGHLHEAGVRLVIVPAGTPVAEAIAAQRAGRLRSDGTPSACGHGRRPGAAAFAIGAIAP